MLTSVAQICEAYEAGIGQGLQDRKGLANPYTKGSDEAEAWSIGYREGLSRHQQMMLMAGM